MADSNVKIEIELETKRARLEGVELENQIKKTRQAILDENLAIKEQERIRREASEQMKREAAQREALADAEISAARIRTEEAKAALLAQRAAAIEQQKAINAQREALRQQRDEERRLAQESQENAERNANAFGKVLIQLKVGEKALELVAAGFRALGEAIVGSIGDAIKFEAKLAEISTLFSKGFDVDKTRKDLLDLSSAFGLDQADVAKGYYDTVSAGITDAAEAAIVLEGAAKLATGGLTSQATAIDGLTNIIKGYALDVSKTAEITDTLFIGAQVGKTTIDELSRSIGQVSPLANAAGVSFQETVAAMSALTLSGKTTAEATTGLRGAIENLLRPNAEMTKSLEKAGITSVTAALQTDGLTGVFQKLQKTTGGTTEGLAKIFGSVEGLQAVLSLAGPQAGDYATALKQMGDAARNAGEVTDGAVNKMRATAEFQLKALEASFRNLGTEVFSVLEPGIAKAAELLVGFINDVKAFVRENEEGFRNLGKSFTDFVEQVGQLSKAISTSDEFKAAIQVLGEEAKEIFTEIRLAVAQIAQAFGSSFGQSGDDVTVFRETFRAFVSYFTDSIKITVALIGSFTEGVGNLVGAYQAFTTQARFYFNELVNVIVDNLAAALNAIQKFLQQVSTAFRVLDTLTGKTLFSGMAKGIDEFNAELNGFTSSIDRTEIAAKKLADTQKKIAVDNVAVMKKAQEERQRIWQEEYDGEKESNETKEFYAKQAKARIAQELEAKKKAYEQEKKLEEQRKKDREQAAKDHKKYLEEQKKAEYEAFKAIQDAEEFNNEQIMKLEAELTDDLNKESLVRATRQLEILKEQTKEEQLLRKERDDALARALDAQRKQEEDDRKQREEHIKKLTEQWKFYAENIKLINEGISQSFGGASSGLATLASGDLFGGTLQSVEGVVAGLKTSFSGIGGLVSGPISDYLTSKFGEEAAIAIKGVAGILGDTISTAFSGAIEVLKNGVTIVVESFKTGFALVTGQFISDFATSVSSILATFESTSENLKKSAETLSGFDEGIFGNIAENVNYFVTAFVENIPRIVQSFVSNLPKIIESIVKAIPAIVKTLISELPKVLKAVADGFPVILKEIIKAIPEIVKALIDNLGPFIEALARELPTLVETLIDATIKLNDKFGPLIVKLVSKLIQSIIKKIPDIIRSILELIPEIIAELPKIIEALVQAIPRIIEVILQKLPAIILAIVDAIPQIIAAIIAAIPQIINAIAQNLPTMIGALIGGIIARLPEIVITLVGAILKVIPELVLSFWNVVKAMFDFKGFGGQIWEGLKGFGDFIGQFFKDIGGKIWEGISSLAETIWAWFKDIGARIWNGLKDAVGDVFERFGEWGRAIWEGFVNAVKSIVDWFKEKGMAIWEGLRTAVGNAWETLKKWGYGIWDGFKTAVEGVWEWIKGIGRKIWEGLKEGLSTVGNFLGGGVASGGGGILVGIATGGLSALGNLFSEGGIVGGRATVAGDSTRNDTVPAMLSPGELVVPRTAMDNGLAGILAFARDAIGASSSPTGIARMANGGIAGGASTAMASPFDGLIAEIQSLRADVNSIGYSLAKSAVLSHDILDRWNAEGLPQERDF